MPQEKNVTWKERAITAEAEVEKLRVVIASMYQDASVLTFEADRVMRGLNVDTVFLVGEGLLNALCETIDALELSVQSRRCFLDVGVEYVYQVVEQRDGDLLLIKNFDRRELKDVKGALVDLAEKSDLQFELHIGMGISPLLRQTIMSRIEG